MVVAQDVVDGPENIPTLCQESAVAFSKAGTFAVEYSESAWIRSEVTAVSPTTAEPGNCAHRQKKV